MSEEITADHDGKTSMEEYTLPTNPEGLVAALVEGVTRFPAYRALVALGDAALPAIRGGLKHDDWRVRKWSAMCLDQVADEAALADLVPLLRDPISQVRLWAVHSISCDHCKEDVSCPVDVVPHLIERIQVDGSIRVRRMAAIMLGTDYADPRALPVLEGLLGEEDRRLRLHAENGLRRYRELGLGS